MSLLVFLSRDLGHVLYRVHFIRVLFALKNRFMYITIISFWLILLTDTGIIVYT